MKLTRGTVLMSFSTILGLTSCFKMVPTCQCDRDTSTLRAGFCSSNYAFKGTVLSKNRVIIRASSLKQEESNHAVHPPSDNMHAAEQVTHRNTETEEYHVLLETNYKGMDQNLVGRIFVIYNDDSECTHVSLEEGNTYVFQLNILKLFDACDRVDLFRDISESELRGLRKDFSKTCPPQLHKRSEDNKQKDAHFLHSPDITHLVESGDDVTEEERGNYWNTVAKQSKPVFTKWDKKCKCHRPVYIKKTERKLRKNDTK